MKKYIVYVSGGMILSVYVASFLCKPNPLDEITRIVRRDYDPFCSVLSYYPAPEKVQDDKPINPFEFRNNYIQGTATSSTATLYGSNIQGTNE